MKLFIVAVLAALCGLTFAQEKCGCSALRSCVEQKAEEFKGKFGGNGNKEGMGQCKEECASRLGSYRAPIQSCEDQAKADREDQKAEWESKKQQMGDCLFTNPNVCNVDTRGRRSPGRGGGQFRQLEDNQNVPQEFKDYMTCMKECHQANRPEGAQDGGRGGGKRGGGRGQGGNRTRADGNGGKGRGNRAGKSRDQVAQGEEAGKGRRGGQGTQGEEGGKGRPGGRGQRGNPMFKVLQSCAQELGCSVDQQAVQAAGKECHESARGNSDGSRGKGGKQHCECYRNALGLTEADMPCERPERGQKGPNN